MEKVFCSACGATVYRCPDPACECFHHAFDTFEGYEHEETGCTIGDVTEVSE